VSAVNTTHRPCPTPGPSSDRAQGQPRLSLSVALTECATWVLNCERAYFVFGHTSFAKLRQKIRKHESVAGAISTVLLSHVETNGILRDKDVLEISRPPDFLNQTDVLVNGVGRYAVELDPGAGLGRFPIKTPILLILGMCPDERCRGDSMTFQQIQLSHEGETIPGVRGYHQARPQVGECRRRNELAIHLREGTRGHSKLNKGRANPRRWDACLKLARPTCGKVLSRRGERKIGDIPATRRTVQTRVRQDMRSTLRCAGRPFPPLSGTFSGKR
jgi:hypothetical protein